MPSSFPSHLSSLPRPSGQGGSQCLAPCRATRQHEGPHWLPGSLAPEGRGQSQAQRGTHRSATSTSTSCRTRRSNFSLRAGRGGRTRGEKVESRVGEGKVHLGGLAHGEGAPGPPGTACVTVQPTRAPSRPLLNAPLPPAQLSHPTGNTASGFTSERTPSSPSQPRRAGR